MFDFGGQFWTALIQIIGVNIVLSGDNAVVIALACRKLPPRQQRIGILLGAGAAILLRIIFTVVVVQLMAIPTLKIIGGLLLFWIGWKLLVEDEDHGDVDAGSNLIAAVRIVLIADAVMSLDNVIAVAAAAKGNMPLIVLGLIISIPMVVFGAAILIKLIERYPIIVTIGAALVGYVGGEVIVTDPLIDHWVHEHAPWLHIVAPVVGAAGLVAAADIVLRRVAVPKTAGEAVAAPAAVFGARAVLAGLAGLTGGKVTTDDVSAGWLANSLPILADVWPGLAAAAAVAVVEVAARYMRRPASG